MMAALAGGKAGLNGDGLAGLSVAWLSAGIASALRGWRLYENVGLNSRVALNATAKLLNVKRAGRVDSKHGAGVSGSAVDAEACGLWQAHCYGWRVEAKPDVKPTVARHLNGGMLKRIAGGYAKAGLSVGARSALRGWRLLRCVSRNGVTMAGLVMANGANAGPNAVISSALCGWYA